MMDQPGVTETTRKVEGKSVCEICKLDLKCLTDLHTHQRIAHGFFKDYKCVLCKFEAPTRRSLESHCKNHERGCKYQCDICYQLCTCKASLIRHIRYKHTHEKPWKCDYCQFAAVEEHKLTHHLMEHTGELPFPCGQCNKSFKTKSAVRTHQSTHTGQRDYICILCFQLFRLVNLLKQHMLSSHAVGKIHIIGINSIKKNGMPETLGWYLDSLCLSEKSVMKDKPFKYVEMREEYSWNYTKHFKNVSSVIYEMEMKRNGCEVPETAYYENNLRGLHKRLFLADLNVKTKVVPELAQRKIEPNKINRKRKATSDIFAGKDGSYPSKTSKQSDELDENTLASNSLRKHLDDKDNLFKEAHTETTPLEPHDNNSIFLHHIDKNIGDKSSTGKVAMQIDQSKADFLLYCNNERQNNKYNGPVGTELLQAPNGHEDPTHAMSGKNDFSVLRGHLNNFKLLKPNKNKITKLVREAEGQEKRAILLSNMKKGGFGSKPHVIKVLPDGTIIDCTDNYKEYLPS